MPPADAFQSAFGKVEVLKILQTSEDGFPDAEGLGASGAPGESRQAFLDGLRKTDGQHKHLAI